MPHWTYTEFNEVNGVKIHSKVIPNADLFLHFYGGKANIADGYTGYSILVAETAVKARLLLGNKLRGKRYQNGGYEQNILRVISEKGLSPRYEVKK
jgi:hypothetical protein